MVESSINVQLLLAFDHYLGYERRASNHTRKAYKSDLLQLSIFLFHSFQIDHFTSHAVTPKSLRAWVYSLDDFERRSIKRKVSALRSFFRFLHQRSFRQDNPAAELSIRIGSHTLPNNCSGALLAHMYNRACETELEVYRLRDLVLLDLLYGCGLRRSEASTLVIENVDLNRRVLQVLGKGNKIRQVPIPLEAFERIVSYLTVRSRESQIDHSSFLVTDRGLPAYPQFIYRRIQFLSTGFIESPPTHPHALRHAYASNLIDGGAELGAVSKLLGHTSSKTTQVYVHNSLQRLRNLYMKSHPRNSKT
jgi:integrase/recombinase XerC